VALKIEPSTLTLPPSDRRDQIVKEIDAACREVVEVTHKLQDETNERMIGRLEERWFTLRRKVFELQERAYLDEGIYVSISASEDALPIRVNKVKKMLPWGLPFTPQK